MPSAVYDASEGEARNIHRKSVQSQRTQATLTVGYAATPFVLGAASSRTSPGRESSRGSSTGLRVI